MQHKQRDKQLIVSRRGKIVMFDSFLVPPFLITEIGNINLELKNENTLKHNLRFQAEHSTISQQLQCLNSRLRSAYMCTCTVCSEKIAPAIDHPNEMPTYRIFSPLLSDPLTS